MSLWGRRIAAVGAAFALQTILISCTSGPRPPEKGTPAYDWALAKETYAAGNYLKTMDSLEKLAATENEFTARATPWLLVLTSGMARGYMEAADYFEAGARINKADPGTFRKQVGQNRNTAGRLALRFAEAFGQFQKTKDDPVVLAFPFPTGSAAPVGLLLKVGNGMLPQPSEIDTGVRTSVMRGVVLSTCNAAGNPNDFAKTQELFKGGEVKVPRGQFVLAMAGALHDAAQLYARNKLDDPRKIEIFCTRAQEALQSVPSSKQSKELIAKIQATLKKSKI